MSESKRALRVGIIGTGAVASEHARAISLSGGRVKLTSAADLSADRLSQFCATFDVERKYGDSAELIGDPEIDVVAITTPPAAHEALAVAALDAGKYVLCEKPLAHSLASARRIVEAAERHPGRLSVSYQFRYQPQFRRLQWLASNDWVGKIQSALIARHSFTPPTDPANPGWWGAWSVAGGGVLITQLIHELDMLELVMGKSISVCAEMDTRFTTIESEDFVQATINFEGGRTARCVAAVNCGYLGGAIEFRGSYGSVGTPEGLILDDPQRQRQAERAADQALPETCIRQPTVMNSVKRLMGRRDRPEPLSHTALYLEIAKSIERGEPLPIPASEGLRSLELCMAIYESALTGKEVTLPLNPDSRVFEGVLKSDYDARPRPRALTAPAVFRRANRRPLLTLRNVVVGAAKRALNSVGVSPATVRSLMRRRAPVHGGPPVRRTPWPTRRHFGSGERRAAWRLLTKEMRHGAAVIYGGAEEEAYCKAFAEYLGGGYADAVNSGSNAIYIALRALNLEPGSEVIVPPITDPGGAMPVALNLCIPVPADSAPGSILTDAHQISKVITDRTRAIIVAHMGGHAVDMDPVLALATERGIPIIEDCAQSHGTIYKGRMVGSLGAISAFSTMFGKQHATGGQGGVVFTQDPILFARAKQAADRGKSTDAFGALHNVIGSLNFNQDELSMAIGRVQLAKLPSMIRNRRIFAGQVEAGLRALDGVELVGDPAYCESSYWYLMVRLDQRVVGCNSQVFADGLKLEGIDGVNAGYSVYPTDQVWHRQAALFGRSGLPWSLIQEGPRIFELPNARAANQNMVRIDVHENFGPKEARDLVAAISKVARYYRA